MVMIQTEEINKYVKKRSTLRKKYNQALQANFGTVLPITSERIGGRPIYITKSLTYNWIWMFTKVNMCKSGIDHTSNGYYYSVMAMRTIFCLRQVKDEPMKAYYRRFEAFISINELEKCNTTNHTELNKSYADGDNEYGNKRSQEMCIIMYSD